MRSRFHQTVASLTRPLPSPRLLGLIGALTVGAYLVAQGALLAPALTGAFLVVSILIVAVWPRRFVALPRLFLMVLAIVLAGYAIIGRGFAHLGVPPVFYVGEIALFLGILVTVAGGGIRPALRSPILWMLAIFMGWCLLRTLPFLDDYGLTALRDGATWGYGIFAFFVAGILLRRGPQSLTEVLRYYRKLMPWIVILVPILIVSSRQLNFVLHIPGAGTNFIDTKPGPMSVQLAGVGVFLALGLQRLGNTGLRSRRTSDLALLAAWMLIALMTAILNRGGMLAMGMALAVVFFLRPSKQAIKIVAIAAFILGILLVIDPQITVESGREYNTRQLAENFLSVFDIGTEDRSTNTRQWRLDWWNKILDYTVFGPYFWTGKGFGVNLAVSDGIYGGFEDNVPLRSPHNGHLTVLARAGVPGFVLWVVFLTTFGVTLLLAYLRARQTGQDWIARIDLWLLAFWMAFLVNMSFTVYLEGPHGGIWFWSLIGFAVAFLEWQRSFVVDNRMSHHPTAPAARYTSSSVS